jgi:Legionella pneumophila major outer membrane protein precursor
MRTRTFMLAAAVAALLGLGQSARAQFAPMGGPAGPYADMMAPSSMGMGPGGMPGPSAYAPPAFAPAAYAGMGGPAPMGPMPGMGGMPGAMGGMQGGMGGMPMDSGYGDYCDDCAPGWTNHYFAFGEALFIRPRNAEVAYAVPINGTVITGPTSTQVQIGAVRVADPDYAPGFRVGFGAVISPRSAMSISYTQFDRDTFDTVSLPGTGGVIRSLVTHPNPLVAAGNGLDAAAILQTEFELIDADYKGLIAYDADYEVAFVIGARYANLEQHFAAGFAPASGFEEVLVESEFDGGGLKLGLEGMRRSVTSQFFVYGKGATSFVAGDFRTRYQFNSPTTAIDPDTSFKVGRIVTMLDLETGIGWQNFTGNLRFSTGYMFTAWYNTVRVNELISAVQQNNFVGLSNTDRGLTTFDGVTAKIELLW